MRKILIEEGSKAKLANKIYTVYRLLNLSWVMGIEDGTSNLEKLKIADLEPLESAAGDTSSMPINLTTEEEWATAKARFAVIRPILENRGIGSVIDEVVRTSRHSKATLYRWVELYEQSGTLQSLVPKENTGGRGKSRLNKEMDDLISEVIGKKYLNEQNYKVQDVCLEVKIECRRRGIEPPHSNSVRYRINQISEYQKMVARQGKKAARHKFDAKIGSFPSQDYPLETVQIDHTKMDIIVVDETYRKPIGRPYITMAIDVHSRMVLGFYISMDPPGAIGTGMCICHAIMPKEGWLAKLGVEGEWPCWGIMHTIHTDNAMEFKGHMLARACEEYHIDLERRPPRTPHFGGTIERQLKTFLHQLHKLPGTTFSNTEQKKEYDSVKEAVFTLTELERWFTEFVVNVYHQKLHTGIQTSPLAKYKKGIFGDDNNPGIGIPPRIVDERKLRLDFMPFVERSIQNYGVVIDGVHYYHDSLRRWINSMDPGTGKQRQKRKFVFKRDPRDISKLYFLDPEAKEYYDVPYRDTSRPPMSIWEFNEVVSRLKEQGKEAINEEMIFKAYEVMKKLEEEAVERTRRNKSVKMKAFKRTESRKKRDEQTAKVVSQNFKQQPVPQIIDESITKIYQGFDDLEF